MNPPFLCDPFYPSFFADFIMALVGAILGIGGAYLIYIFSINRVRRDRLKYVVSLIESVIPSAKRQSGFCKEHAEAISAKPFENLNLKLDANRDTKRLSDKMDQEGVYHAYLWAYKRNAKSYDDFRNLYGFIDYLDYLLDDLIKTNERILEFIWQRKKQYQVAFKKLKELVQALSLDQDVKAKRPEFVEFAIQTMQQFLDNVPEAENIAQSFTDVVEPTRQFIAEKVAEHPKVTEIYLLLDDLVGQYYGIELQVKHNAEDYKLYSDALAKTAEQLDSQTKQMRLDYSV